MESVAPDNTTVTMFSDPTGLIIRSFKSEVDPFTLCFKDPAVERDYIAARCDNKITPENSGRFIAIIIVGYAISVVLNIISDLISDIFSVYSVLPALLILVIILIEASCSWFPRFTTFRGMGITMIGCFAVFYDNLRANADQSYYPYVGTAPLLWAVANSFIHMHYVKHWRISACIYSVAFVEVIVMILYYYGPHFWNYSTGRGITDTLYYVVAYSWLNGCSVFAVRTHEQVEREGFYAKRQLEAETKEWKKLLGDIPEPIIFTLGGSVQYFNKATLKLFNITSADDSCEDEARQKVTNSLYHMKQKSGKRQTLKEIIDEKHRRGSDAEDAWELGSGQALFVYRTEWQKTLLTVKCVRTDASEKTGVVEYIFHDVTALKALEQNKAKEKCFDVLLATVSHDIRTPLNVMLGVIDLLEDYVKTDKGREQVTTARSCGQKMLHYLKGLSFIRKINVGSLTVSKKLFSPSRLAKYIMSNMEISSQLKNLKFDLRVDPSVPKTVCSDVDIYSVILLNLIENAIKYTFLGGVTVQLRFNLASSMLFTSVIDTGTGMTEEQLTNVGVLFNDKSPGRCDMNPQGLGVGLYLAKTLPTHLKGQLHMDSQAGHGTTAEFSVACFPMEEATVERKSLQHKVSSDTETATLLVDSINIPGERECDCTKILLVDDDPLNLLVLSGYLSSVKIKADKAENGKLALELIEKGAKRDCCKGYSLVFMDINMPVMDGVEATCRIKEMLTKQTIPGPCCVVAVTAADGLDNPAVYASYLEKGFTELLSKPVQKTDFLQVLKRYTKLA